MTKEEINALLSKPNNAIVGVNRANGAPQLTVVWYAWDEQSFFFSTTKDRAKYLNLRRDPSISLIVDDLESHKYIAAYGQAEILEHDFEKELRLIIQKYVPAAQQEQSIKSITGDPSRVIVILRPEKFVTH